MNAVTAEELAQLLDRHAAALELYAAQWTDASADAVQEAFLELIRLPSRPERAVPWLYRVVRYRAINAQRAARRRRQHETNAATQPDCSFLASPDTVLDAQVAADALGGLPDEQREVIVARIWGGLTYQEIAELVGVTTSTVHRRYQAGLALLRERLSISWTNKDH